MNSAVTALRYRRAAPVLLPGPAEARERSVQRRVAIVWGLLVLNVLTFYPGISALHIPSAAGKLVTQGSLVAALAVALTVNRRVVFRPSVFLSLVSLMVVEALITSLQPRGFGTVYRTFRFAEFVAALWLITPWWGRRDLLLVRCYLLSLGAILASVILGLFVAPGRAIGGGRLTGVIWPIPDTQVAHYAAVTMGLVVVLWLGGMLRGKPTALIVTLTAAMLILTHTRTALVAMVAGILVAGLSLFTAKARVRKFFASIVVVVSLLIMTAASVLTAWLQRGQGSEFLTTLTGRTNVWGPIVDLPRTKFQEILGFGLSNDSFNGLPIDSNWLASYMSQGLFGVTLCAVMLLFLLINAFFQPPGVQRALALFLVTYCLVASFTEVGFTNVTAYLLDLTVAASLMVPPSRVKSAATVTRTWLGMASGNHT